MKNEQSVVLFPAVNYVTGGGYRFGEAVPVNIFIDGQKVEAPNAGIKIGRPMFPDIQGDAVAVSIGDYVADKEVQE